jgi:hypothetical protein
MAGLLERAVAERDALQHETAQQQREIEILKGGKR